MNELVPALKDTLFAPTYELVAEYAEIGIDSLRESDALKDIPIVSTLAAICKVGYNIRECNLIKQTLDFIMEFNAGTISQEKKTSIGINWKTIHPKQKKIGACTYYFGKPY